MLEVKEPKGIINVDVETDKNGEFRRLTIILKHSIEIDVDGTAVIFCDSDVHMINYLPTKEDEVKKIIYEKLEKTLKTACDRAAKMEKIINMLENIASGTGCDFDITISKYDC
jgi:hypothetical protein